MTASETHRPTSERRWAAAVLVGVVVSFAVYVAGVLFVRISPIAALPLGVALGAIVAGRVARADGARQWITLGIVTAVASFVTTAAVVALLLSWAFR